MASPFLLVGLGNPGPGCAFNRHNIGFMVIDVLFSRYSFPSFKSKFQGFLSESTIKDTEILLFKPQTYMNLSGKAVKEVINFYKIPSDYLYIVHDDLDLMLGKIKLKLDGGNGGHNGLKSLDQYLGPHYWRIRFGIGRPLYKEQISSYVLSNFTKTEQKQINDILEILSERISSLWVDEPGLWMNKVHQLIAAHKI